MDNGDLITDEQGVQRCWWPAGDAEYTHYHDHEWGVPVDNDVRLFEKMCLEGFQAGLSWLTILRKRENFRAAFAGFDFKAVAQFNEEDVQRLLQNEGIIRHRGKIEATINNARMMPVVIEEFGSFAAYIWQFEPVSSARPGRITKETIPSQTPESNALSKDLKKRGFKFVGPTTMYALMQAMGMVNDHIEGCTCRATIEKLRENFVRPVPL